MSIEMVKIKAEMGALNNIQQNYSSLNKEESLKIVDNILSIWDNRALSKCLNKSQLDQILQKHKEIRMGFDMLEYKN